MQDYSKRNWFLQLVTLQGLIYTLSVLNWTS